MIIVPESEYAILFLIILLAWPLVFINAPVLLAVLLIINIGIFLTVIRFTSGSVLNFWDGLKLLPRKYMSGCANITLLYIFFVLMFHYAYMVKETFAGISRGREYTRNWWLQHVKKHTGLSVEELVHLKNSKRRNSLKKWIIKILIYIIIGLLATVIIVSFIL